MKVLSKFMQGASKSTGKSLDNQGFFACLSQICPTFIYQLPFQTSLILRHSSKNFLKFKTKVLLFF